MSASARYNAALTAKAYKLVKASHLELLDTGYFALVGECGHRLRVLHEGEAETYRERMKIKPVHKRCEYCVKDTAAHEERLFRLE